MAKLTLSVESGVVSRAKQYAESHGVSLSAIVEAYLAAVTDPRPAGTPAGPVLRSVRGILKKADIDDYRDHLTKKYR